MVQFLKMFQVQDTVLFASPAWDSQASEEHLLYNVQSWDA